MKKQIIVTSFLAILVGLFQVLPAIAQVNEIRRQQSSLRGIQSFYLVVNVEGSKRITQNEALNVPMLTQSFKDTLKRSGLHILDDTQRAKADNSPYLYVHINTMDAGRGLVPFSVEVNFYQPVNLVLNRSRSTLASTWETSAVGIVSLDQIKFIIGSAVSQLKTFESDFHHVNQQL